MNAITLVSALAIVFGSHPAPASANPSSLLTAAATTAAQKGVSLTVNVTAGQEISGEQSFRVSVNAKDPITQVEFYVGDDLRDSDTSTPYEFKLDSLNENDGDLKLRFKAYTTTGATGEKVVTVKVANGVDKGAPYHVEKAIGYISDSKFDAAITEAKIALKADPKSNPARIAMARANLGKGVWDQAQKYAEDAVAADGNDAAAHDLLSSIHLQKAFRTYNRGGDRKETLSLIGDSLKAAITNRRASLDLAVDRLGSATDANRLAVADAAIRAGRYSLAINVLQAAFTVDNRRADLANRIAFAQIRSARMADAKLTLDVNKRNAGSLDAYGLALYSVIQAQLGDDAGADETMKDAILSDSEDLGVRTAQAFLALKREKNATLGKIAADLARDQGQRSEVTFYLSSVYSRLRQYSEARSSFQRSALAEPANVDLYIEQGNQAIGTTTVGTVSAEDKTNAYETARVMFLSALVARPESAEAMTGLVVVSLLENKIDDAVRFGRSAIAAAPSSAVAHYGLAAAAASAAVAVNRTSPTEASKLSATAQSENLKAGSIDRKSLEGREIPNALAVWRYISTVGRTPVIAPPK